MKKNKIAYIVLATFLMHSCFVITRHHKSTTSYESYPYYILGDSFFHPSGVQLVAVRTCRTNKDTLHVLFHDLVSLKYNEYKALTFQQFDSNVIKKIYNGQCLDVSNSNSLYSLIISRDEYNNINADSMYQKFFPMGEYGPVEAGLPNREIWVALLVLFDNKFNLRINGAGDLYTAQKAMSDYEIKHNTKNKLRK